MPALPLPAFPIDGPVLPERRQIGRDDTIADLTARVVEQATHQWIVGPRRIGKTSVAKASAARLRADGHVALELDLSRSSVRDDATLASELARQARAAGVGSRTLAGEQRLSRRARRIASPAGAAIGAIGDEDPARALEAVAALLGAAEERGADLGTVLQGLALAPALASRRIMVLLDEVHRLRAIGCEAEVAAAAREAQRGLVFVFAGSEESVIEELRGNGPLANVGQSFTVPEITTHAWLHGLGARFEEIGLHVPEGLLYEVVEASAGHPRSTMLICSYIQSACRNGDPADAVLVRDAIDQARKDRSWT